jgi:hypothetical protein
VNPTPHRSRYLKRSSAPLENEGAIPMKAFVAALIAVGILYVADIEFNNGQYAEVVQRAITSVL